MPILAIGAAHCDSSHYRSDSGRVQGLLGRGGNPHVADELAVVPASVGTRPTGRIVFARGKVRHVDHDTVYLPSWSKVVRNTEAVADDGIARMDGIRWID